MELFLNCIWLFLGLSLVAVWTVHVCRTGASASTRMLPSRRLQFTAVLLLVILLFPVISLSDDLAICTAPRDAERALRLHDLFAGPQPPAALLPSTMAWMDAVAILLHQGSRRPIEQEAQLHTLLQGMHRPVESRPPPFAS